MTFLDKIIKDSKTYQEALEYYGLDNVQREKTWQLCEYYYGSTGWLSVLDSELCKIVDDYNNGKITLSEMLASSNIFRDLIKVSYMGKYAATHTEEQDNDSDSIINWRIRTAISDEAYEKGLPGSFSMKPALVGYDATMQLYRQRENFITLTVIGLISEGIFLLNSRVIRYALQEGKGASSILVSKTASVELKTAAEAVSKVKALGATDEVIEVIMKSEGVEGLATLENLLSRGFASSDVAVLSKYGIKTSEYAAKGINYSKVAENLSRMLNTSKSYVDLYRAVGPDEFVDIMNTGIFKPKPGGEAFASKQFGFSIDEILQLTDSFPDSSAIVRARIPKDVFVKLDFNPVDITILKSGSTTVYDDVLNMFNDALMEVKQVF